MRAFAERIDVFRRRRRRRKVVSLSGLDKKEEIPSGWRKQEKKQGYILHKMTQMCPTLTRTAVGKCFQARARKAGVYLADSRPSRRR
jgi:hypothetical protein